ncbi:WhiB family transcriptional regulator [Streptomyces sp. NPDC048479]|uniref:WhiB family transcriptional regulator n=1 Tax=Streptomyces sp. NPDC048479 TaxID=3154725 RepID=UPI0034252EF0
MTTTTDVTRRPRKRAVSPGDWHELAACAQTDPELFHSDTKQDRQMARTLCRRDCPVIVQCLSEVRARDEQTFRWGIGGGLSPDQRRALDVEERLGRVPNFEMARSLVTERLVGPLLRVYRESRRSLPGVVEVLRGRGLLVDEVTVRVALWWAGVDAARVPPAPLGDQRPMGQRLYEDYAGVMLQVRDAGGTYYEVAWYLGVFKSTAVEATKRAEADRAARGAVKVA